MVDRTRALVRLAASLTGDEAGKLAAMDEAAAADPAAAEEVLLQSYLFLGFPVALNALGLWRRRTGRPPPEPAGEPAGESGDDADPEGPERWAARGVEVCRKVYGHQYEALREVMRGVHPELDRWALVEGYGKVLGRPGLDLVTRELCVGAMLAGIDATRQLHAHLRGCLNVGAGVAAVEAMLAAVEDLIPPDRAREAGRIWERVRDRWMATHREQG